MESALVYVPKAIGQVIWFSRNRAIKQGARLDKDWLVWSDEQGTKQDYRDGGVDWRDSIM